MHETNILYCNTRGLIKKAVFDRVVTIFSNQGLSCCSSNDLNSLINRITPKQRFFNAYESGRLIEDLVKRVESMVEDQIHHS